MISSHSKQISLVIAGDILIQLLYAELVWLVYVTNLRST